MPKTTDDGTFLENAKAELQFILSFDLDKSNTLDQYALYYSIIKIGEIVKNLSTEKKKYYTRFPWRDLQRLRNYISHIYFRVDFTILYDELKADVPRILQAVEKILAGKPDETLTEFSGKVGALEVMVRSLSGYNEKKRKRPRSATLLDSSTLSVSFEEPFDEGLKDRAGKNISALTSILEQIDNIRTIFANSLPNSTRTLAMCLFIICNEVDKRLSEDFKLQYELEADKTMKLPLTWDRLAKYRTRITHFYYQVDDEEIINQAARIQGKRGRFAELLNIIKEQLAKGNAQLPEEPVSKRLK